MTEDLPLLSILLNVELKELNWQWAAGQSTDWDTGQWQQTCVTVCAWSQKSSECQLHPTNMMQFTSCKRTFLIRHCEVSSTTANSINNFEKRYWSYTYWHLCMYVHFKHNVCIYVRLYVTRMFMHIKYECTQKWCNSHFGHLWPPTESVSEL